MSEPSPNGSPLLFAEFLDDFYAECDEHLAIIRRNLLALEHFVGVQPIDAALLGELFRSFHSLKGLAGMAGASAVEGLAHELEAYLRALKDGTSLLTPLAFDVLIASAGMLEQLLTAQREHQPIVADQDLLLALQQLNHADADPPPAAAPPTTASLLPAANGAPPPAADATANGNGAPPGWRLLFTPSPALAGRQISVNSVRARLQAIGEICEANPRVGPDGGIVFEFLVATHAGAATFAGWAEDGITAAPVAAAQPESPPPAAELPPAAAAPSAQPQAGALSSLIRVDISRLDSLMDLMGDLVISRSRLADHLPGLEPQLPAQEWRTLQETSTALERQLRNLREGIMRMRLVPIGELFARMQFAARDLAREHGKLVQIEITGQDTEVDKFVVERIADAILHLVRNAISHGIEPADERRRHGKAETATLALRAFAAGDVVTIDIEDDGGGIDAERVIERARQLDVPVPAAAPSAQELLDLIALPGFSTRAAADRISGRGIGMDVVQQTVNELGGQLTLATEPGRGSHFRIVLPISVSIVDALVVSLGDQLVAMPLPAVREIVEVEPGTLTALRETQLMPYRERALPLFDLARFLYGAPPPSASAYALVIGHEQPVGMIVHHLRSKREIVVRPLADPLLRVPGCMGLTELGDGRPIFILDAPALVRIAQRGGYDAARHATPAAAPQPHGRSLIVAQSQAEAEHFILFEVAGSTYAVRSRDVHLIDMLAEVTAVPNAAPAVVGVVFSRGDIIPALSLRLRFGFEPKANDLRTRLIVVVRDGRKVGLVADTAREFVRLPADAIQPAPSTLGEVSAQFLEGIINLDDRLILILNLAEVLNLGTLSALAEGA